MNGLEILSPALSEGENGARGGIRTHTGYNSHKALNLACLPISPPERVEKEDWQDSDARLAVQAVKGEKLGERLWALGFRLQGRALRPQGLKSKVYSLRPVYSGINSFWPT